MREFSLVMKSDWIYVVYPIPLIPTAIARLAGRFDFQSVLVVPVVYWFAYDMLMLDRQLARWKFVAGVLRLLQPVKRWIKPDKWHPNIWIYIDTAVVVFMSYASLLNINLSYIWLVVFPLVSFIFIAALCNQERLCDESNNSVVAEANPPRREDRTRSWQELKAAAVVPYWVLCAMGQFDDQADHFAVSQFFLFLSSMLGALTLMMARLAPTGVTPGLAPASELLRRATLVTLLVTVLAMAVELLGEDVVTFCLPEIAPVFLCSVIHLHRSSSVVITVNWIREHIVALGAAVLVAASAICICMDESGLSMCLKTSVSGGVSGLLIYYLVFMLRRWPGQAVKEDTVTTTHLQEALELYQLWANVLLLSAVVLVLASLATVLLGLHEPATLAKIFMTMFGVSPLDNVG